jgi:uncharacterized protein (TIGR02265 family)
LDRETVTLATMISDARFEPTVDVGRARDSLELAHRLERIPASAQIRGFIFKMTDDEVRRHGAAAVATYRRLAHARSRWFFRMYSLRDYLEDAAAGAIAINPADPHSVIRRIYRNMHHYAPLFNVQRFFALLSASPVDVFRWIESQRDMFFSYGRWRAERRDENYIVMHYFDDYLWSECHCGAAEGVLDACNVRGTVEAEFDSLFDGRLHIRWERR